ncbi:MAG: flavin reductase family protein [Sphingobium sp.]|nr:flavin reductase family protein [Sphingobium sp.]MBP6112893.1 flavin reductase family protein [Sphingobium sp.]MBP8672190.1 flavin reductase family protein [Sphingobium sp.]MBP9156823.1 flavin reductase family protein [Sphingobium sp.]MCC6481644.1 flavin reductase family protein [Sphingomonadaceae bacterium]
MAGSADDDVKSLAADLKMAMRGFAQSVVIVSTVGSDGARYAMAATAVTPLSMDPPSMLICVNRTASSHATLESGANFALNILNRRQMDVARVCGGAAKGEERFTVGEWHTDEHGVPYLADAQAAIICHQRQRISYGSHDIFIGDVQAVRGASVDGVEADPLVYFNGSYRTVGDTL